MSDNDRHSDRPLSEDTVADLRSRLERAVARACPSWFSAHRDDVVQNALVKLVRRLEQEQGGRNPAFSPMYLMKAAHGAAVDEIRRWCRGGKTTLALDEEVLERRPSAEPGPERNSVSREIGRAIQECLAKLVGSRQLAVTVFLQGSTAPETSRRLGWTLGKTEKLVYRGLSDLRGCLREKGVEP
jgi:RNA polymerase sigma-70 factor (ECF subfamily)